MDIFIPNEVDTSDGYLEPEAWLPSCILKKLLRPC